MNEGKDYATSPTTLSPEMENSPLERIAGALESIAGSMEKLANPPVAAGNFVGSHISVAPGGEAITVTPPRPAASATQARFGGRSKN